MPTVWLDTAVSEGIEENWAPYFSDAQGIVAALDHVLERNMHRVSHNITLIQAQIAQEHRSEWATGVLVYGGCFVVFCVTMMIYMVCIYKGMKGKYDMNMALTGNPINELSFKNCFKGEAKRNSLEQPQNLLTKEATPTPKIITER